MAQIKIEMSIDSNDSKDLIALKALLENILSTNEVIIEEGEETPEIVEKAVKKTRSTSTAKTKSAKEMAEEAEKAAEAEKAEYLEKKKTEKQKDSEDSSEAESDVSIQEIRALLSEKVEKHRSEIKTKLVELGAKSVTTLDVENYDDFYNFLKNL